MRRMINLLCVPKLPHHHARLNAEFRADLWWWTTFAAKWNGVALFPCASITVTSDASGQWGCGALSQRSWFQFKWPEGSETHHIAFKELFAVVLSCAIWGSGWRGLHVQVRCDNQAAVHAVSCKDKPLMHLLRCLFFCEAHYHVRLSAAYLPGSLNVLADHLSRNSSVSFLSKVTDADREPSPILKRLPELLLGVGDWTSPSWTETFVSLLPTA